MEKIEAEALQLDVVERARLAERLLSSLEDDSGIEEAWAAEVERRIAEIESGKTIPVPVEDVITKARQILK
ncbi:MAG: addiction module protein [Spirochaetes bacterium]|nr:addiction module protein [Spirochaetota bacterium]